MTDEKDRLFTYSNTLNRMEPNIALVDRDAALPSIAISLKRIADVLTAMKKMAEQEIG